MKSLERIKSLKIIQDTLNFKIKEKLFQSADTPSQNSETQQLNEEGSPSKQEKSQEKSQFHAFQNQSEKDLMGKQSQSKNHSKIQTIYDKYYYKKRGRKYLREGEIYYLAPTKFFQPQNHYFYNKGSSISKTWPYGSGETSDQLLITSWNINGIRNALHKTEICDYIKKANADFLCMIEVKINEDNYRKKPVKIQGYEGYWNFCKCSAGYSGIAIFSKFRPMAAFQDFQERQFSQQGRVLTLEYQRFYLIAAYIPTAGENLERLQYKVNQFQKIFYKHCSKLLNKKHVIVAGDLNVCHTSLDMHVPKTTRRSQGKHPSSTKKQRSNFQKFLNIGFVDTFRRLNPKQKKYSWYNIKRLGRQKNIGKRLDYFLVNQQFITAVTRSEVFSQIKGSDHCPIQLNLDLTLIQNSNDQKRLQKINFRQEYIKANFLPKKPLRIRSLSQKQAQSQVQNSGNFALQQSLKQKQE